MLRTIYSKESNGYAKILNEPDNNNLLTTWKQLYEILKSKNGSPERLDQEKSDKLKSNNKYLYARIDLMDFGWWNSANDKILHIEIDEKYYRQYKKLFIRIIKKECEEQ